MNRNKLPEPHYLSQREISQKYDRFARWYDWIEGGPELLGVSRLRRTVLQRASGTVIEVAIGTGKNLPTIHETAESSARMPAGRCWPLLKGERRKFGHPETPRIERLIAGIAMSHKDDETRLSRAAAMLDDLYGYFSRKRG